MTLNPPTVRRRDELGRRPQGRRVVNINALKSIDGGGQIGQTRFVDRPHLSFRRAVATALGTLEDAPKILINRVRRDKDHLSREPASLRELCLLDRRLRP